jgi:hypothetical protein
MAQNVLKIGDRQNPTWLVEDPDSLENPVLTFFLNYWRDKRFGATLPLHSSFVPKEIRGHLQWVVTIDVRPGDFRFRLVGTRASEYFLGDGTGKTVREAYAGVDEAFVAGVEWMYRRTCELKLPLRLTGPSSRYHNIFFPAFDSLYLPYSSDGEQVDRIVNIFWYNRNQIADRGVMPTTVAV